MSRAREKVDAVNASIITEEMESYQHASSIKNMKGHMTAL